jgi:hypothetical protein
LSRLGVRFRPFEQAQVGDVSLQVTRMLSSQRAIKDRKAALHVSQGAGRLSLLSFYVADKNVAPSGRGMFFPVAPLPQTQRESW